MTLSEFKAWFEGFTEDLTGAPNKKQWERIKARVDEITGQAVSYPVYIDRYVHPVRPYWNQVWCGGGVLTGAAQGIGQFYNGNAQATHGNAAFDSHAAMNMVGRADALALKAA